MRACRFMTVFLSVFLAVGTYAQDCRERLIDSLSNPGLSPEGRALKFDTAVMDAGTVKEDAAPREYEFFWTNVGDTPVTVVKVTTDCGCAVPSFDSVPVEPGERSSLKITYYPKGRPGNFSRRIFVYADVSGSLPAASLSLRGYVEPSDRPVWNYRFRMGSLCLKYKDIYLKDDRKAVERVLCMNAGDEPLTVGVDTALLPPFLEVSVEPETIPPGGEADIVVRYDPSAVPMRLLNVVPIVLTGMDVPPSQRTLRVIFRQERQTPSSVQRQ